VDDASGSDVNTQGDGVSSLGFARWLAGEGVPFFLAVPREDGQGWRFPMAWQDSAPADAESVIEAWRPGLALCAVMGHGIDVLDVDPRNGGDDGMRELQDAGAWPRHLAVTGTPSGGEHYYVRGLGLPKRKAAPGVDYQAGAPDGTGRGFVFVPPTVATSKTDGQKRPYTIRVPPTPGLAVPAHEALRARLAGERAPAPPPGVDDPLADPAGAYVPAPGRAVLARIEELAHELETASEGVGNNTAARLAYMAGQYVGAGQVDANAVREILMGATDGWTWRRSGDRDELYATITQQIRAGYVNPRPWTEPETTHASSPAEDDTSPPDIPCLTFDELVRLPRPRPLIKNVLNLGSDAWLIGASGAGKSFVALDWALHVATGLPWDDQAVRQGPVLYVAGEGVSGLRQRVEAWVKEHATPPSDDFRVVPVAVQSVERAMGQYMTSPQWRALIALATPIKPHLIVLDTQARMTLGLNENDNGDMGQFVERVSMLRRATGACVLVVHHTGRQGGDARGASAIDAAQDTEWTVERASENAGGPRRAKLLCSKSKDGQDGQARRLELPVIDVGVDEEGSVISSLVVRVQGPWSDAPPVELEHERPMVFATVRDEVMYVLRELAKPDGETQAELLRLVNGLRVQREGMGGERLARTTLASVLNRDGQGGLVGAGLVERNGRNYAHAERFAAWRDGRDE
jgi:hypothetical protein